MCGKAVEIFAVVLPRLDRDSPSADALIAAFERRLRSARLRACSSCPGDYEDPDRTVWNDDVRDAGDKDGGEAPAPEDELSRPRP
jgi:hypothetical protein